MTSNKSLYLSNEIRKQMSQDLSSAFQSVFPFEKSSGYNIEKRRDRVYNQEITLITMINTMVCEDKSLQNSVNIYNQIHENNIHRYQRLENEFSQIEPPKRKGRRKTKAIDIQKSKMKPISANTSGYSQARKRLNTKYCEEVYKESAKLPEGMPKQEFYGRRVYLTDGTYLQMQDTELICKKFNNSQEGGYPRGLLCGIIDQSSGQIIDFVLDSDKKSELELLSRMIKNIPPGSLLLADDLYSCFAIFAMLIKNQIDIIVPGKRKRRYTVIKKIAEGDEIVELQGDTSKSKMINKLCKEEKTVIMRRIEVNNPMKPGETIVLYTTILDESIDKTEIYLKYFSRWDIEISIREIKSIMGMNILRSKSPEMALRELMAGLIAYNYIRIIMARTVNKTDFSPEIDIFQEYYKTDPSGYVDKLGRIYARRSPGRYGYFNEKNFIAQNSETPKPAISKKD